MAKDKEEKPDVADEGAAEAKPSKAKATARKRTTATKKTSTAKASASDDKAAEAAKSESAAEDKPKATAKKPAAKPRAIKSAQAEPAADAGATDDKSAAKSTKAEAPASKSRATKAAAPAKSTARKSAKSETAAATDGVADKLKTRYYHGTGRRKTSIATVKLYQTPGEGKIIVNQKSLEEVLQIKGWIKQALRPLELAEMLGDVTIAARSYGGGKHGQAGAISLGIARSLIKLNPELRPLMRTNGLLTRDPRMRESKKYGLKRARKAQQYTKR